MKREPSLATLKALAEALDNYARESSVFEPVRLMDPNTYSILANALAAYRAEIAPRPRTRAEVDAEIVKVVRSSLSGPYVSVQVCGRLVTLTREDCAQPTAPEAQKPDDLPWDCPRCRP